MKRRDPFAVGEYYHIYNRGVEKRKIFDHAHDYKRFIESLIFFNTNKSSWEINLIKESGIDFTPIEDEMLVEVVAYCVNANHFHLLLKEKVENGTATFMKKTCTGYAMYYNKKNERSGVLFQGRFKSVHIESNEHLLHASVYVNCNSQIHGIGDAQKYAWCSFPEYISTRGLSTRGPSFNGVCRKNIILEQFRDANEYKNFCLENIVSIKKRKELINDFLLEDRP